MKNGIVIEGDFLESAEILKEAHFLYKKRDYRGVLTYLEDNLKGLNITCSFILSEYFDLVASVLWKLCEYEDAFKLWNKSAAYNVKNRHSSICVSLFNESIKQDDTFVTFINIMLDIYKKDHSGVITDLEEDAIIDALLDYWNTELDIDVISGMNGDELFEYLSGLKIL